jgi:hypothetical protein
LQCPAGGDGGFGVLFESPAVCVEHVHRFAYDDVDDLIGFVRAGSIRFDGVAARTCLDQVAARCASTNSQVNQLCRRAFVGTVAIGGGCWRNQQCVEGAWCDHGSAGAQACPGACRAQLAAGAMCVTARQCLGWGEGNATCVSGRCATAREGSPAAEGQPCGEVPGADMSVTRTACATGLACRSSVCRRPLAVGAPCDQRMDVCPPGTACVVRPGTTAPTCAAAADIVRNAPGLACNPARNAFPLCNPTARLTCNAATMTCEALGNGALGARCPPGGELNAATCDPGLRCDAMSSTCVARLAVGAASMRYDDCLSGDCEGSRCLEHRCD